MTDRERLIDLIIEAKRTDPETVSFTEYLAAYLIAHGVVAIPFDFCPKCGRRIKNDVKQGDKI